MTPRLRDMICEGARQEPDMTSGRLVRCLLQAQVLESSAEGGEDSARSSGSFVASTTEAGSTSIERLNRSLWSEGISSAATAAGTIGFELCLQRPGQRSALKGASPYPGGVYSNLQPSFSLSCPGHMAFQRDSSVCYLHQLQRQQDVIQCRDSLVSRRR